FTSRSCTKRSCARQRRTAPSVSMGPPARPDLPELRLLAEAFEGPVFERGRRGHVRQGGEAHARDLEGGARERAVGDAQEHLVAAALVEVGVRRERRRLLALAQVPEAAEVVVA